MIRAAVEAQRQGRPLPFSAMQAVRWALQIASGLRFVHGRGYMHRDIKPGNILLVDGRIAKLADLGSARRDMSEKATEERKLQIQSDREKVAQLEKQKEEEDRRRRAQALEVGNSMMRIPIHRFGSHDMETAMTRCQGTFEFMAPEMLGTANYTKSIDVWSFGVLLIELCTLQSPYPEDMPGYQIAKLVMIKQLRPRKLQRADLPHPDLLNVVEACIRFRADTRPSFAVVENQLKGIVKEMEATLAAGRGS